MSKKFLFVLSMVFMALLVACGQAEKEESPVVWVVPEYATAYNLARHWSCYRPYMLQEDDFPVNSGEVALCYSVRDRSGFNPHSDLPKTVGLFGQYCEFKLASVNRSKIVVSLETSIESERLVKDCREAFYIPAKYNAQMLVAYPRNEEFRLETEILPIPVYIQIITP